MGTDPSRFDWRRNALLIVTGLVVAFVRNYIQYNRYTFDSLWEFFGLWVLHYLAVGLVGAVFYAALGSAERFFLGSADVKTRMPVSDALVFFCLAVILSSVALFVIAHWPTAVFDE